MQCRNYEDQHYVINTMASNSDYDSIVSHCLKTGQHWEDPEFPAVQSSVFYHQTPSFTFQWKRPHVSLRIKAAFQLFKIQKKMKKIQFQEIVSDPLFVADHFEINCGKLGESKKRSFLTNGLISYIFIY